MTARGRNLIGAGGLCLIILAAYLPVFRAGFVWDDDAWVWANPHVRGERSILRVWHTDESLGQNYPLTYTFFWLEARLWGFHPFGYHLANVLLHGADAVLLWLILRRLKLRGAWAAAAAFGLHPINVESVAWVTEAKNVLSAFFLLSSLLAFLRWEEQRRASRYAASLALYFLALTAKTFVATFPLALLTLRWWRGEKISRRMLGETAPFLLLSLLAGAYTWRLEVAHVGTRGEPWSLAWPERILVAGRALWFYLAKIVFPVRLSFVYPRWEISAGDAVVWLYPLLAAIILIAFWNRRRKGRGAFAAAALYAVLLAPALGFISFYAQIYSFVADHYAYLAAAVPIAAAASLAGALPPRVARAAGAAVLSVLFLLTTLQTGKYRDSQTLFRDVIEKNGACWLARNNLANDLFAEGKTAEAIAELETALRTRPDDPRLLANLGHALLRTGRAEEAEPLLRKAIAVDPAYAPARNTLGVLLFEGGRTDEAIREYEEAIRIDPASGEAHNNLAEALIYRGRTAEAAPHLDRAIRLQPAYPEAHNNRGIALSRMGLLEQAIREYDEAIRLRPLYAEAHYNAGIDLDSLGRFEEAAARYRRAIEIRPAYAEAHANLGVTLSRQGKFAEAGEEFREALRIRPDFPEAQHNLARTLERLEKTGVSRKQTSDQ
jgi:Flp pilus assembly protein TadD